MCMGEGRTAAGSVVVHHENAADLPVECGDLRREKPPPIFFGKENAPRPEEKKCFYLGKGLDHPASR